MPVSAPVPDCQFGQTVTVLRPGLLAERRGGETLVVCGAARGFTSIVSYVLVELGYPMGTQRGPHNHEDMAFQHLLLVAAVGERSLRRMPSLPALIAQRNAAYPRWGFKVPLAVEYMPDLERMMRNPVFVICLRSPAGVMQSIHSRPHDVKGDVVWLMRKGFGAYAAVHAAAGRLSAPIILADMDAARLAPGVFLDEFCTALGLTGDLDRLAAQIARPGYKDTAKG